MVLPCVARAAVSRVFVAGVGSAVLSATPSAPSVAALSAVTLAAIHVFAGRVQLLSVVPRSRLLSFSGGASVAYVFVHVLPELERTDRAMDVGPTLLTAHEEAVYLLTLLGFVTYYGLERIARRSGPAGEDRASTAGVFWLHVGSFVAYNALIGYLLFHRETPGVGNLLLYAAAMAFHLLVNDVGLRDHHADAYHRTGRWLLAGGMIAGAVAGSLTAVDRQMLGALFAFLAGGIVLNVIKEELPSERQSRFSAFAVGAGGYAVLLLSL